MYSLCRKRKLAESIIPCAVNSTENHANFKQGKMFFFFIFLLPWMMTGLCCLLSGQNDPMSHSTPLLPTDSLTKKVDQVTGKSEADEVYNSVTTALKGSQVTALQNETVETVSNPSVESKLAGNYTQRKDQSKDRRKEDKKERFNTRYVHKRLVAYNKHCGKDNGKYDKFCDDLLLKIEKGMQSKMGLRRQKKKMGLHDRRIRNLVQVRPESFCLTLIPFKLERYSKESQICCNGIHDKISGNEICCGNQVVSQTATLGCCQMDTYNKTEYLCCDGVLHSKTDAIQACCGTNVYDVTSTTRCCQNKLYDPMKQFCCDNNFLFNNIGKQNNHGGCCGVQSYDDRCYACNRTSTVQTVYPVFDPISQLCCQGRIKPIEAKKTECCGRKRMDGERYTCVNYTIVQRAATTTTSTEFSTGTASGTVSTRSVGVFNATNNDDGTEFEETEKDDSKSSNNSGVPVAVLIGGIVALVVVAVVAVIAIISCFKRTKNRFNKGIDFTVTLDNVDDDFSASDESIVRQSLRNTVCNIRDPPSSQYGSLTYQTEIVSPGLDHMKTLSCLTKSGTDDAKNFTSELVTDAETQTSDVKLSNARDVFGNVYQHHCYLDSFNRTLTWNKSDSKMTLPEAAVREHKIEAHASSFDDIPSIYEKFSLPPDIRLASPVVEFRLPGTKVLGDFAVVELPVIDNTEDLEVWKCPSDEGMYQTLERQKVPILNIENNATDLFYLAEDGKVRVYTKSFSVFFCTCKEKRTNFCLRALLFGSYKKIRETFEVRLSLYIADELHKFLDYNQRMLEIERLQYRELKCDQELKLHKTLKGEDILEMSMEMTGEQHDIWIHKRHPSIDQPLEAEHKTVQLDRVARCCNTSRSVPYQVSWYLENRPETRPDELVQCMVNVCCKLADQTTEPLHTPLMIDELWLRAKDRREASSDQEMAAELKDYLTHYLSAETQISMNAEIKRHYKLRRDIQSCQDLQNSLDHLYNDMKPAAFRSTVATLLDDMHLDVTIDQLLEQKFLTREHIKKPYQACANEYTVPVLHNTHAIQAVQENTNGQTNAAETGNCRRELEESVVTSYDNRHSDLLNIPQERVVQPRPELGNLYERQDSDTEVKTLETAI